MTTFSALRALQLSLTPGVTGYLAGEMLFAWPVGLLATLFAGGGVLLSLRLHRRLPLAAPVTAATDPAVVGLSVLAVLSGVVAGVLPLEPRAGVALAFSFATGALAVVTTHAAASFAARRRARSAHADPIDPAASPRR